MAVSPESAYEHKLKKKTIESNSVEPNDASITTPKVLVDENANTSAVDENENQDENKNTLIVQSDYVQIGQRNTYVKVTEKDDLEGIEKDENGNVSSRRQNIVGSIENVGSVLNLDGELHFFKDSGSGFVSIGECCRLVKISISQAIGSRELRVNVDDDFISLIWQGDNDNEVNTEWKIEFLNAQDDELLTKRIMDLLQGEEFKQLRELVMELNKRYEAKLRHIGRGCIQMILSYKDSNAAEKAISDRREILEIFQKAILIKLNINVDDIRCNCKISTDNVSAKKEEDTQKTCKELTSWTKQEIAKVGRKESSMALMRSVSEAPLPIKRGTPLSTMSYPLGGEVSSGNAEEYFGSKLIDAQNILQQNGLIFILGAPGSGKTYISEELIKWMRQKYRTITTATVNSPSELKDKFENFREDVLVVDLDKSDSDSHQLIEYAILIEKLFTFTGMTRHSRINCIFMGSKYPDQALSMFILFRRNLLIDLNRCLFKKADVETIFKNFQSVHPENKADFDICSSLIETPSSPEVGVPLIIEMLTLFPAHSKTILEDPLQYVMDLVRALEKEDKDLFLSLLTLFLASGVLNSSKNQSDVQKILAVLNQAYDTSLSISDIFACLKDKRLMFFVKCKERDTIFEFTHSFFGKVIFSTFSQRYMDTVLRSFPLNLLRHLRPISSEEAGYIDSSFVDSEYYTLLAARIRGPSDLNELNPEFIVDYDFISEYVKYSNVHISEVWASQYRGLPFCNFLLLHGSYKVCELLFGLIEIHSLLTDEDGWSVLHCSVASPIDSMKKIELLKSSFDFETVDNKGNTPLHIAAYLNRAGVFRYLLMSGANPQRPNKEDKTPIHIVRERGYDDLLHMIQGKDTAIYDVIWNDGNRQSPTAPVSQEKTPLTFSLSDSSQVKGSENHLRNMIESNVPEDELKRFLATIQNERELLNRVLIFAVECLNLVAVRALCEFGSSPDTQNDNGLTPLHVACHLDQLEIVRYLLQKANPNRQDVDGDTPLHTAVRYQRQETVNLLLNSRTVNLSVVNRNEDSVLHVAAKYGRAGILQNLISKSPSLLYVRNLAGQSPLHVAILFKKDSLARVLIEKMDDFSITDINGLSCLELAVRHSHEDILSRMLQKRPNADFVNTKNETLLHVAAELNKQMHAECLIKKGADINASLPNGQTPLHVAVSHGSIDVTRVLLDSDVTAMKPDKQNFTALHYAKSEQMKTLLENRGCRREKLSRCSIM